MLRANSAGFSTIFFPPSYSWHPSSIAAFRTPYERSFTRTAPGSLAPAAETIDGAEAW